jgi:hypothetical protein
MFRHRHCALVVLCLSALSCPGSGAAQAPSTEASSAKIWVGRYREIEEYLRTAECLNLERLPALTMRCALRPGGPVARMAWMVLPPGVYRGFFTSYKTQIAAYELDRLLKLDMVPPTVERQVQGSTGAATLWVENVVDMRKGDAPSDAYRAAWEKQLARVTMLGDDVRRVHRQPKPKPGQLAA